MTELKKHTDFDAAVFAEVHALQASGGKYGGDIELLFERYLNGVSELCAAVDGWNTAK